MGNWFSDEEAKKPLKDWDVQYKPYTKFSKMDNWEFFIRDCFYYTVIPETVCLMFAGTGRHIPGIIVIRALEDARLRGWQVRVVDLNLRPTGSFSRTTTEALLNYPTLELVVGYKLHGTSLRSVWARENSVPKPQPMSSPSLDENGESGSDDDT